MPRKKFLLLIDDVIHAQFKADCAIKKVSMSKQLEALMIKEMDIKDHRVGPLRVEHEPEGSFEHSSDYDPEDFTDDFEEGDE
jgi:hypothetical protein